MNDKHGHDERHADINLLEFACGAAMFFGLQWLQRKLAAPPGPTPRPVGAPPLDDSHPLVQVEVMRSLLNSIRLNEAAKNTVVSNMGRIC